MRTNFLTLQHKWENTSREWCNGFQWFTVVLMPYVEPFQQFWSNYFRW